MSAFPSSRRVNLWLQWKQLVQALPGKAGGTAVMTTVDHTLMRGSKPHDRDASRSCLGLETCVGSATRQIVVSRVLLTAAAPPALPGSSMSNGSLAPPLDAITRFLWSIRRRRHAPGDGPDEAGQFTGDRGSNDIGRFAAAGELAIARA